MSRARDVLRKVLDVSPLDVIRYCRRLLARPAPLSPGRRRALARMRADNAAAGAPFAPSEFWRGVLARQFEAQVTDAGLVNAEEQAFNRSFSGFDAGDVRLHRYVCWLYQRALEERDTLRLLDRLRATCPEGRGLAYRFGERVLSLDLLLSIDDFYNLCELHPAVATEPVVLAELGAGWGRLAHVALSANPRCTYLIFDLPEPLLISQTYLPKVLGNIASVGYAQAAERERLTRAELQSERLWFFGAHHLPRLTAGSVDVGINVASFQEMPLSHVTSYLQLLSKVTAGGHVYLRQLFDRRSHGHTAEEIDGLAAYPFPPEWDQRFVRPSRLSDEFFEAGFGNGRRE
jgi:putative sugar O-methyltransferase